MIVFGLILSGLFLLMLGGAYLVARSTHHHY